MTELEIYAVVRQALLARDQVLAVYGGLPRELCPHELGKNRTGERHCLFYQFGGESHGGLKEDGSADNYRCMAIAELKGVTVRKGAWHMTQGPDRSSCVAELDVTVFG